MLDDARHQGVNLTPNECYRDYEGQVRAREDWCNRGQCQKAAAPGTSLHGWGRAVDFAQMEFSSSNYRWLKENAARYHFDHPAWAEPNQSAAEPWHWEWTN